MYTGLRIDGDGDEDEDRKKQQRWTPNRCYDMCYDMRGGSVLGFPTRHLGPIQMTTDTALGVTKLVVDDKSGFPFHMW